MFAGNAKGRIIKGSNEGGTLQNWISASKSSTAEKAKEKRNVGLSDIPVGRTLFVVGCMNSTVPSESATLWGGLCGGDGGSVERASPRGRHIKQSRVGCDKP